MTSKISTNSWIAKYALQKWHGEDILLTGTLKGNVWDRLWNSKIEKKEAKFFHFNKLSANTTCNKNAYFKKVFFEIGRR